MFRDLITQERSSISLSSAHHAPAEGITASRPWRASLQGSLSPRTPRSRQPGRTAVPLVSGRGSSCSLRQLPAPPQPPALLCSRRTQESQPRVSVLQVPPAARHRRPSFLMLMKTQRSEIPLKTVLEVSWTSYHDCYLPSAPNVLRKMSADVMTWSCHLSWGPLGFLPWVSHFFPSPPSRACMGLEKYTWEVTNVREKLNFYFI